jgi:hypothetical protein
MERPTMSDAMNRYWSPARHRGSFLLELAGKELAGKATVKLVLKDAGRRPKDLYLIRVTIAPGTTSETHNPGR